MTGHADTIRDWRSFPLNSKQTDALLNENEKLRAERQQAIDALREIMDRTVLDHPHHIIARAALLSLGEQP